MGPVEVDGAEPVLRATGGSEEPLSISDTGEWTLICCWEEATALKKRTAITFKYFSNYPNPVQLLRKTSCYPVLRYNIVHLLLDLTSLPLFHTSMFAHSITGGLTRIHFATSQQRTICMSLHTKISPVLYFSSFNHHCSNSAIKKP